MQKLIDYQDKSIWYGSIFRFPAKYPCENVVDFMLVDNAGEFLIYVSSGTNAGDLVLCLPIEAMRNDVRAIDTKWIIENWQKYIYPESAVEDVYIIPIGYPVPSTDNLEKLIDYQEDSINCGAVLRFPGTWPYEKIVDYMIIDIEDQLFTCVGSGYKCGAIYNTFPREGYCKDKYAIATKWLIENWNKWIYLDCKVEDVYILPKGYPVPRIEV